MANTINLTVELGPESQAKLDKILEALQAARPTCESCADTVAQYVTAHCMAGRDITTETPETAPDALNTNDEAQPPETTHPVDDGAPWGDPEPVESQEPAPTEEPEAPTYTKADVQALVQKLAAPTSPEHKRSGARAIVKSYGAKVSDIPEGKYPEVMKKLTALDKEA